MKANEYGEKSLNPCERKKFKYADLIKAHQMKVLKCHFGGHNFKIKDLERLKHWLGKDTQENEFFTNPNGRGTKKYYSVSYV